MVAATDARLAIQLRPERRGKVRRAAGFLTAIIFLLFDLAPAGARVVQLRGNVPQASPNLRLTRRAAADKPLHITIFFALRDHAALDKLLAEQQDPNSPQYHRWLTPDEFAARFGPSESDFHAVTDWFHSEGLDIELADIKSREIRYSDTVSHAEQMFSVHVFSTEDGRLFGNREAPSVPERFDGVIAFIDGLDNLRAVAPASASRPDFSGLTPRFQSPASMELAAQLGRGIPDFKLDNALGFGPADVQTFYDETPLLKSGVDGSGSGCVALIELSDFPDAGISEFDQTFSLPDANITRVLADNTNPGVMGGVLGLEASLDPEWAHATAPGVPLKIYIGDPTKVEIIKATADAGQRAINDNSCGAINISLGSCGVPESFFPGVAGAQAAQAASQGMSVFVASGDFGAAGLGGNPDTLTCLPEKTRGVNELAASPNVTGVGGTQATPKFDSSGNDVGFVEEQVWNEQGIGASGGGPSGAYPKPDYQKGQTPNDGARDVPDVAALAAEHHPGFFVTAPQGAVLESGGFGTSFGAPIWSGFAALIAQLAGERLGNINQRLYQLGPLEDKSNVGLRDVTAGNNSFDGVTGFNAGPLYDLATGWGSPDVAVFAKAFLGSASPTETPGETPTPSGSGSATPTATPSATGTPTATASVIPSQTATPTPNASPLATPTATPTLSPQLVFSTLFGSGGSHFSFIALGPGNTIYVAGTTTANDFPITPNALEPNPPSPSGNIFLAVIDPSRPGKAQLVYSTYVGDSGASEAGPHNLGDFLNGLAVDKSGRAYLCGWTTSTGFPVTGNALQTANPPASNPLITQIYGGPASGFFMVVDPKQSGADQLVYSTYLGGSDGVGAAGAVSVDDKGLAYITGSTTASDFPVSRNPFQRQNKSFNSDLNSGFSNAFVSVIDPSASGNASLIYSTFLGGADNAPSSGGDEGEAISTGPKGLIYVAGMTATTDFPITPLSAFQIRLSVLGDTASGSEFLSVLNPALPGQRQLVYSTYLGGNSFSGATSVAVDSEGNAYVGGNASNLDLGGESFPITPNAFRFGSIKSQFVQTISKIDPFRAGSASLVYSTIVAGPDYVTPGNLVLDARGLLYVVGNLGFSTESPKFPTTNNAFQPALEPVPYVGSGYLCILDTGASGNASLVYSSYLGQGFAGLQAVAVDSIGRAYIAGGNYTRNLAPDVPITSNSYEPTGSAFVVVLSPPIP